MKQVGLRVQSDESGGAQSPKRGRRWGLESNMRKEVGLRVQSEEGGGA